MTVTIIGSGPAGLAAAIEARSAGLATTIITQHTRYSSSPERPLESIHPGTEVLLEKLGLEQAVAQARKAVYTGIFSGNHFSPLSTDPTATWHGSHIDRNLFDKSLLQKVRFLGVDCMEGHRVVGITRESNGYTLQLSSRVTINTDFLIDASGRTRLAGKKLGICEVFHSRPLTCWSGVAGNLPAAYCKTIQTSFIPETSGWTWLAPQLPDRCTWTRLALTAQCSLLPPDDLKEFPTFSKVRSANMRWRIFQPVARHRLLMTGDAAGVLDPGAGQGILQALMSGMMAVQAIKAVADGTYSEQQALQHYTDWFTYQYEQKARRLRDYYNYLGLGFHKTATA